MLEKFFILHRTGRCILSKSFGERSIHLSLLHSLISSTSTLLAFSKRHHSEHESNGSASTEELSTHLSRSSGFDRGKATTIAFGELQFVFLDVGPFLLVAQALRSDRNESVTRIVFEVHKTMTFYLGTFSAVAHDDTVVEGILDYIEHALEHTRNLRWLVDGLNIVPLDSRTLSTLDRLMATFEESESIIGSVMVIGNSVLHSRMPVPEALEIVQHLSCRPMNQATVRMIPVFVKEKAQHLIFVRINAITLALLTDIRTSFSELVPYIEHFECALEEDAFQLPKEEPSILLRHFTGHDTLAFLFHDEESGITVAPAPRVGPSGEQNLISNRFRWFFNEVRTNMSNSGIEKLTIQSDEHVFHFHSGKGTQLYTLFSRKVDHSMLSTLTAEIIDNIGRVITLQ